MQNAGFLYMMMPVLKKLNKGKQSFIETCRRHMGFFNIQPYFVTILAGIVLSLEKENADREKINTLKMTLTGPISAVGDSFFWGTWRPFTAFVAAVLFLLSEDNVKYCFDVSHLPPFLVMETALLVFLVMYNIPVLYFRLYGLIQVFRGKMRVADLIGKIKNIKLIENIRETGLMLALLTVTVIVVRDLAWLERAVFAGFFSFAVFVIRKGLSSVKLFYLTALACCVMACLL